MLNRVILRGYVADDPFIRATERGKLARIRMITIEYLTNKEGQRQRHTEWHTVDLWGENADITDYNVRIGMSIEIEGSLRSREWQDKGGATHKITSISAHKIKILSSIDGYSLPDFIKRKIVIPETPSPKKEIEVKRPADDPDELPF